MVPSLPETEPSFLEKKEFKSWVWMIAPIMLLVTITAIAGLFFKSTYVHETASWAAQARGQDLIDLVLVVPVLSISAIFTYRGSRRAFLTLIGALIYTTYSYVTYAFFTHFGPLFLLYVATLGLSFYTLILLIANSDHDEIKRSFAEQAPIKAVSAFLILVGVLFALLWLKEIVTALLAGTIPQGVSDASLPNNPVYTLDLAFLLPGMIITAGMLLQKRPLGYLLAAPLLVFANLMGLAIISMVVFMSLKGLAVSAMMAAIIGVMILISFILLIAYLKTLKS